jgi:hypothetical protein
VAEAEAAAVATAVAAAAAVGSGSGQWHHFALSSLRCITQCSTSTLLVPTYLHELLHKAIPVSRGHEPRLVDGVGHVLAPERVDAGEAASLHGHLPHDIRGPEDGLEVEPRLLAVRPLVEELLRALESGRGGLAGFGSVCFVMFLLLFSSGTNKKHTTTLY